MERTTAIFFMSFIGLFALFSLADGCMCDVEHPQARFCKAAFAFAGRIEDVAQVELEGLAHIRYTFKYSPHQVFKGKNLLTKDRHFNQTIYTSYHGNLCGRPYLEVGRKYLLTGSVESGGNLMISFCNWVEEWGAVTEMQRYYLRYSVYASNCARCKIPGTVRFVRYDQNLHEDYANNLQMSGYWSLRQCHYNPIASIRYGSPDCEAKRSYCTYNVDAGMCLWKWSDGYGKCFQERETLWQILTGAKPAFTSLRQCRDITSSLLRKKCKKTMKKQRKLMKQQKRLRAQLEEEEETVEAIVQELQAIQLGPDLIDQEGY